MQAMIFAAGKGTRLKPLTDSIPKALVEVKGKTLLARTIESLKAAGCERIVVNVHYFSEQIKDYLARHDFGIDIRISDETSRLLDTGGGIKSAAALLDVTRPVLIHNVDILSNVDLQDFYNYSTGADVRMLVSRRKTKRYLIFNTNMRLVGWTNIETSEIKSPYPTLRQLKFEAPDKVGYLQPLSSGFLRNTRCGAGVIQLSTSRTRECFPDNDFLSTLCRPPEHLRL